MMKASVGEVWWRPEGRSPFSFDPAKPLAPQIVSAALQSVVIFGGPLIGLAAIANFPVLIMNRTLYITGLSLIGFWFISSFAFSAAGLFRAECRHK